MLSFEDWEVDEYLLEKKDYKRYLDYKIKEFLNDREDVYRIIELAEAYNLNKMHQEAIDFISKYYYKWVGEISVDNIILNALFGMNKSEHDFKWINKPIILRRDNICDYAFDELRDKRRYVTFRDIFTDLIINYYSLVSFEEFEFLIQADKRLRFRIEDEIKVKVKTKKELEKL